MAPGTARFLISVGRWPWPFLLLLVGAGVAASHLLPQVTPSSSLILTVFLPPLLFDAGFSLQTSAIRREWRWILLFGLAGSLLAGGIAFGLLRLLGFPYGEALLLAAVLAATDPVSVFAALRRVRTPSRLRIVLEGESLVNDGVAVIFTVLALQAVDLGHIEPGQLLGLFLRLTLVGLAIGSVLGIISRPLSHRLPRPAVILLSIGIAYAAYLISDRLGGSGLVAVITAALLLGSVHPMPTHRQVHRFWRALAFILASIVFLLMGVTVHLDQALRAGGRLAILFAVMLLARALMVLVLARLSPRSWPATWQVALTWAGLRGALSLALVLSTPSHLAGRAELLTLAFGFVFLSLALQGLSIVAVFRWLRIPPPPGLATA